MGMFLIALIPKLPDCGTFDKFLLFIEKNARFLFVIRLEIFLNSRK